LLNARRGLQGRQQSSSLPRVKPLNHQLSKVVLPLLGLLAAAVSLKLGWGFMVDDALITTRVAHQLAASGVHRFNPTGIRVDCVTPLGFAWLVAPLAKAGPLAAFFSLRFVGAACYLATGISLGLLCSRAAAEACASTHRALLLAVGALIPLALSLPLGAWGSSGMETPFVMLFCTLALFPNRGYPLWLALACSWRPELIPWAVTLAALRGESQRERFQAVSLTLLGPLLIIGLRLVFFGHPAPLAIFAKPSDFDHGLSYVLNGLRLLGIPILLLGLGAWKHQSRGAIGVSLAFAVHLVAVCAAGGDWMPYFRLFVPVLPGLVWAGYRLMLGSSLCPNLARCLTASGVSLALALSGGSVARQIVAARSALIQEARPALQGAWNIGSLDVGWVGAASEAPITSKRLPGNLLESRQIDRLVLLLAPGVTPADVEQTPWQHLRLARTVEQRVARLEGAEAFSPLAVVKLNGTAQYYLILKRAHEQVAAGRFAR
jgi:hypothetical protein